MLTQNSPSVNLFAGLWELWPHHHQNGFEWQIARRPLTVSYLSKFYTRRVLDDGCLCHQPTWLQPCLVLQTRYTLHLCQQVINRFNSSGRNRVNLKSVYLDIPWIPQQKPRLKNSCDTFFTPSCFSKRDILLQHVSFFSFFFFRSRQLSSGMFRPQPSALHIAPPTRIHGR